MYHASKAVEVMHKATNPNCRSFRIVNSSLNANQLSGTIPENISNLGRLKFLYVIFYISLSLYLSLSLSLSGQ